MIDFTTAKKLFDSGLCVVPTVNNDKRPAVYWTEYQDELPEEDKLKEWFSETSNRNGLGCVCGRISGNLEVLDFDDGGSAYLEWQRKLFREKGYDIATLPVERTPSGGFHIFYRCDEITGGKKLAMTEDNRSLIETRGEGNFIKCSPSDGYAMIQGNLTEIPAIGAEMRKAMIDTAYSLNKHVKIESKTPEHYKDDKATPDGDIRPGDDFNVRGDEEIRRVLEEKGWKYLHTSNDGNERWERPGKDKFATSATLKFVQEQGKWFFYNFSSSVEEFTPNAEYNIFEVYTIYKFNGDHKEAASHLAKMGYGSQTYREELPEIDLDELDRKTDSADEEESKKAIENIKHILFDENDEGVSNNKRNENTFNRFPLEALPAELRDFIDSMALSMNQNPASIAMIMLSFLGGIMGASVRVKLNKHSWEAAPIIWTCIVGISGAGKSPVIKITNSLYADKEKQFREEYLNKCAEYAFEYKQYEKEKKKGENVLPPVAPGCRKVAIQDASYEGLVKDVNISGGRTVLNLDELNSLFAMMNRTNTPGEAAKWLTGHSGGIVSTSRSTSNEVYCQCAYWTIYGGSTPERFREYIMASGGDKDGTLSRFCLVWVPYNKEHHRLTDDEEDTISSRFKKMKRIVEAMIDFEPVDSYQSLTLNPDVKEDWENIREKNFYDKKRADTDQECSLYSKGLELVPRVAVVLHCLKSAIEYINSGSWSYMKSNDSFGIIGDIDSDETNNKDCMTIPDEINMDTWNSAKIIADWILEENFIVNSMLNFIKGNVDKKKAKKVYDVISEKAESGATIRDIGKKIHGFRSESGKKELLKILELFMKAKVIEKKYALMNNNKVSEMYFACESK